MNERREDTTNAGSCGCYYHPQEVIIGVCPYCLNERLLILAASAAKRSSRSGGGRHGYRAQSQGHMDMNKNGDIKSNSTATSKKSPPTNSLPKIFALGSLLNRLEFRHWRSDIVSSCGEDASTSTSPEDSFISIKFEDNGLASWEKNNHAASKVSLQNCKPPRNDRPSTTSSNKNIDSNTNNRSVIEHVKPLASSLRWRKRIGHLFHLMRWKRSSKGNVCHVGAKVEGVKVRSGWMRSLTKRRAKEA